MKYDKVNGDVGFLEGPHRYENLKDKSIKYTSVTTLIEKYGKPFDKEWVSKYKALERLIPLNEWKKEKGGIWKSHKIPKDFLEVHNITEEELSKVQQQILDEWQETNKIACERGTKIHAELENSFYKAGSNISLQKFGIGGKFICKKDYSDLDLEYGVYPEYLIYYDNPKINLHIAGQIDLIVKNGNDIHIIDHKGLPLDTPIATEDGWKLMKDLNVGDKVFDKDGKLCNITVKSEIHNNPCYKIEFDNTDSIICDYEHRWLISFSRGKGQYKELVMTTEELAAYIQKTKEENKWKTYNIPKILNAKPLDLPRLNLPIDPYVLGCWLGDGSSAAGCITNKTNNIWNEIKNRGYTIGDDISGKDRCEMRTIIGLYPILKSLDLVKNKHIPDMYLRASYSQRLDLLRGLMDTDGYYHPQRHRFVMTTDHEWQMKGMIKLCSSLGIKVSVFDANPKCNGKTYKGWNLTFSTNGLNPFLSRNQDIEFPKTDKNSFRIVQSVEPCDTVPTQCIAVDSPSHTYLAGYSMIPTHNTNAKIDTKGFYNSSTRTTDRMLYPLSHLDECNFNHYQLQLSTYAWMLQKINPEFVIKSLILNHYDHDNKNTLYNCSYLKDDVEKMLKHFAKQQLLEKQKAKYARIEY